MSVRAVAVRAEPRAPYRRDPHPRRLPAHLAVASGAGRARIQVVPRERVPVRSRLVQAGSHDDTLGPDTAARGWLRRWGDDRRMIRLKALLLAALLLLAMGLEVPL